ncbi:MAG: hypothetical protein L0H63_13640 [Nitrococcus sp.]|nr:hypothetical protein [Nitrococcus sp.]
MNEAVRKVADSEGLRAMERISSLLLVPTLSVIGLLFWGQFEAVQQKLDENSDVLMSQQVSAALYHERVDKVQAVQATLRELVDSMRTDVQEHEYEISSLQEYRRHKVEGTRPNR